MKNLWIFLKNLNMADVDPVVSKYFSDLSKKRKNNRGGFNDPAIQAKIAKIKKEKRDRKTVPDLPPSDTTPKK